MPSSDLNGPVYIINATAYGKEAELAKGVQAMGYDAWVPTEVISYRPSRKTPARRREDRPIIPLLLFAGVPEAAHGDLQDVKYFDSVERDDLWRPLEVPRMQYLQFRCAVEDWNEMELRRIGAGAKGRPAKKVWRKLDRDNLQGVLATLFGGRTEGIGQ